MRATYGVEGPAAAWHARTMHPEILQIEVSDDSATLSGFVMAQHFMPRQGARRGAENALLMNRYDCDLVRDGQKWRLKRITISNAWAQGDPEILNALASERALRARSKPPPKD